MKLNILFFSFPLPGGSDGYMSDGDALNLKSSPCINQYYPHHHHHHGHQQHLPNSPPSQSSIDDGYLSEGGASFYARKIQSRIALEKQKTAEEQARKFEEVYDRAASKRPLPGLPDVLGGNEPKMNSNSGSSHSEYSPNVPIKKCNLENLQK